MKRIFLTLFVGFVGLISFGYCQEGITGYYNNKVSLIKSTNNNIKTTQSVGNSKVLNNNGELSIFGFSYIRGTTNGFNVLYPSNYGNGINCLMFDQQYPDVVYYVDDEVVDVDFTNWHMVCADSSNVKFYTNNTDLSYYKLHLSRDYFMNYFQPQYTSEQCQSEYSLMPISSCDSEYCEMNDLCSTIGGSGSSTLYINDVRHEAAPFIYVNIPEEFKRDYLTGEQEFTINVEGLNGDQDYINGIIDVNSFRPSSEDFTQTFVGGLTLIFPYIIITAVILFIRRFIRKIFK